MTNVKLKGIRRSGFPCLRNPVHAFVIVYVLILVIVALIYAVHHVILLNSKPLTFAFVETELGFGVIYIRLFCIILTFSVFEDSHTQENVIVVLLLYIIYDSG